MALKPVSTKHVTKLVCNFCGHIQDDFGIHAEHEGEETICACPVCNIGELQYKQPKEED